MDANSIIAAGMGDTMLQRNIGSIDGRAMIKMNNLAVGYFPADNPEIGVYPPLQPAEPPQATEEGKDAQPQIIDQIPAARY
jgi:hypothetical protein